MIVTADVSPIVISLGTDEHVITLADVDDHHASYTMVARRMWNQEYRTHDSPVNHQFCAVYRIRPHSHDPGEDVETGFGNDEDASIWMVTVANVCDGRFED